MSNFPAIAWTAQDTFNEMKLDLDIVGHWNNSTRVDMSFHSIPIPSRPVFAFKPWSCVLSGEPNNTNFIVFGLTRLGLETTIYLTRGERWNNNAIDAFYFLEDAGVVSKLLYIDDCLKMLDVIMTE
jgi:hypothetical protein